MLVSADMFQVVVIVGLACWFRSLVSCCCLLMCFVCFGQFCLWVWQVGSVRWFHDVSLLISFVCFGSIIIVGLACWFRSLVSGCLSADKFRLFRFVLFVGLACCFRS